MHVVLIEDDEDLRFAIGIALKSGGFTPVGASDCDEAAQVITDAAWRPSAILLDLHLQGGMSPQAFVGWLRERGFADVPVVVCSAGYDAPEVARKLGVSGYLMKPFSVHDLVGRVTRLVERRSVPG